jgi:hypothetical protein
MCSVSPLGLLSMLRYLRVLLWPVRVVHGVGSLALRLLLWFWVASIGFLMLAALLAWLSSLKGW